MKLLLDNNISYRLVERLKPQLQCEHVSSLGLDESDDRIIWNYAKEHGFHILTKDDDFVFLSNIEGYPPKVVWLRMGNCRTSEVLKLIETNLDALQDTLSNEVGVVDLLSVSNI